MMSINSQRDGNAALLFSKNPTNHQLTSCGSRSKVFVPTRRKRKQPVHRTVTTVQIRQEGDAKTAAHCMEDVNANMLSSPPKHCHLAEVTEVSKTQEFRDGECSVDCCNNVINNTTDDVSCSANGGGSSNTTATTSTPVTTTTSTTNNDNIIIDNISSSVSGDNHKTSLAGGNSGICRDVLDGNIVREEKKGTDVQVLSNSKKISNGEKVMLSVMADCTTKKHNAKDRGAEYQTAEVISLRTGNKRRERRGRCTRSVAKEHAHVVASGLLLSEANKSDTVDELGSTPSEKEDKTSRSGGGLSVHSLAGRQRVAVPTSEKSTDAVAREKSLGTGGGGVNEADIGLKSSQQVANGRNEQSVRTQEEMDILNMFSEVEVLDQSHAAENSTKKTVPQLTERSLANIRDVVIGSLCVLSSLSPESDTEVGKTRESEESKMDADTTTSTHNRDKVPGKGPIDHTSPSTRAQRSAVRRKGKKVLGQCQQRDTQENQNELQQDSNNKIVTRERRNRVKLPSDEESEQRIETETRDEISGYVLRRSTRNTSSKLSRDGNSMLCSDVAASEKAGSSSKNSAKATSLEGGGIDAAKKYLCEYCSYAAQSSSHIMVHTRTHTGERPYKCKICKKGFIQQSALRVHLRIHSNARPYHCGICKSAFRTSGHLSDHLRIHTGERPYMCITCRKTFRISSHLQAHIRIHNNERAYKCGVCEKAFIQSSQLKIHEKTHNRQAEAIYACDLCKRKFLLPWNLQLHMRAVHSQGHKPFRCDKCDKSFTIKAYLARHKKSVHGSLKLSRTSCPVCGKQLSKFSMRRHMLTHATEKKYVCKMCSKGFNFSHNLLVHLRVHTESMSYDCPVCDVVFDNLAGMRQHMKRQHRVDPWDKKFWCTTCNRSFFNKGMLSRHRREVHTAQRLYACDTCGKAFKNERNLRQHIKGHDRNTFIQCDHCEKRFSQRGNLKIHVRTVHNKIKDFTCDACSAKFATKRNLVQHIRTHTGEKPFKCQYCPKQFTQGSSLNRHEMTHTGERPFKCDTCQKSFVQKIHLVGHMRTHRTEKCPYCNDDIPAKSQSATHLREHLKNGKYRCPLCNKQFISKEYFSKHCENVCQVDDIIVEVIIKALAKQEKGNSVKSSRAKEEESQVSKLNSNKKGRSVRNEPRSSEQKLMLIKSRTSSKRKRLKTNEAKKLKDNSTSGGDVTGAGDGDVTGDGDGGEEDNLNIGRDSSECDVVLATDLIENNNSNNNNNNVGGAKMFAREKHGLEPLDLSVDQNSNKQVTGHHKPLTHTYAITDANTKIVLQQL